MITTAEMEMVQLDERRTSRDDTLLSSATDREAKRLATLKEAAHKKSDEAEAARAEAVGRIHTFRDLLGEAARCAHILERCQVQLDWATKARIPELDRIVAFDPERISGLANQFAMVQLMQTELPQLIESRKTQLAELKQQLGAMAREHKIDAIRLLKELRVQGNDLPPTAEQLVSEIAVTTK